MIGVFAVLAPTRLNAAGPPAAQEGPRASAAATPVPWSVSLSASATLVPAGTKVSLTATTNQDVATYNRVSLEIWQGPENVDPAEWFGKLSADGLAQCSTGTTCTLTKTLDQPGAATFAALIVTRGGYLGNSGTLASSKPVKVTWGTAPASVPTSNPPASATGIPRTSTPSVTATKTSVPPPTPAPTLAAKAGLPLCPEATSLLDGFGADRLRAAGITDPSKTGLLRNKDSLLGDFQAAIKNHNLRFPDDKAYVTTSTPGFGELGAVTWLFSNGPVVGALSSVYVTGAEPKLVDAIKRLSSVRKAEGGSALLTPGDVLELAIGLNGGNVNQAVLTAHNTLRALGRGDGSGAMGIAGPATGFFDSYLVKLRDGNENVGPWYHLFGTAYLELTAKGDWGPWLATGGVLAAAAAGLTPAGPAVLAVLGAELLKRLPSQTPLSRVANAAEQLYRENAANDKGEYNKPDPEKFCFNVWGAQIGKILYESLPFKSTRPLRDLFSSFSAMKEPSPALDPLLRLGDPRFINLMGSPFSVQWNDGTMRMVLDQGTDRSTASLSGGVPMLVLPVLEEDSWGLAWLGPENSSQTVTFEAARAGAPLHFLRADTQTGQTAVYEAVAAQRGERFSVNLDPVTLAPALRRADGSEIKPQIVTLQLTQPSGPGDGGPGAQSDAKPLFFAGLIIATVAIVAGLAGLQHRSNARAHATARGQSLPRHAGSEGVPQVPAGPGPAPPAPAPAERRCEACGATPDPGARYCGSCGTAVRAAA